MAGGKKVQVRQLATAPSCLNYSQNQRPDRTGFGITQVFVLYLACTVSGPELFKTYKRANPHTHTHTHTHGWPSVCTLLRRVTKL